MNIHVPPLFVPPRPEPPAAELGFLPFLRAMRTDALQVWTRAAYEEDVRAGRAPLTGRTRVLINGADAIHRVLVENTDNYRRNPLGLRILRPVVGDGLLLSEGDDWRHQRRTMAPALAPRVMPMMARHVAVATHETVARLTHAAVTGPVDVLATMQVLALEIASRAMFSLEMTRHGAALRRHLMGAADLARPTMLDLLLPATIPTLQDFARMRFRRRWTAFMDDVIEARLQAPADPDKPRDLFDLLLAARDPETGAPFSRAQLRDQMATMMVAGHETTALTLFWSMYLLASSPADQDRVAAEVRTLDLSPDGAAAALTQLRHTRAVVNETLRLYPSAPMLSRIAVGPDEVGGLAVPGGALIVISPWVLHRHRRLWDAPDAFDPQRFLSGQPHAHRYAYMPFGAGPRICIGAQLALTEACLVLATLIQRFEVRMAAPRPVLPAAMVVLYPDHPAPFILKARR